MLLLMIDLPMGNASSCLEKPTKKKNPKHLQLSPAKVQDNWSFTKLFCLYLVSGLVPGAGETGKKSSPQTRHQTPSFISLSSGSEQQQQVQLDTFSHIFPPPFSSLLVGGAAQPQPTSPSRSISWSSTIQYEFQGLLCLWCIYSSGGIAVPGKPRIQEDTEKLRKGKHNSRINKD